MLRHALPLALLAAPAAAEYRIELIETGQREYYCTAQMRLTNLTDALLTELSGYFYVYEGAMRVGRSKGTWFMNVAPGESAEAVFETPNAPCEAALRYEMVVGACRFGPSFEPVERCGARLAPMSPVGLAPGS